MTEEQIKEVKKLTGGKILSNFASSFVEAIDQDSIYEQAQKGVKDYTPTQKDLEDVAQKRMVEAIKEFVANPEFMERLPEIRKETEQIIDESSIDIVEESGYSPIAKDRAIGTIKSFREFIKDNKD